MLTFVEFRSESSGCNGLFVVFVDATAFVPANLLQFWHYYGSTDSEFSWPGLKRQPFPVCRVTLGNFLNHSGPVSTVL